MPALTYFFEKLNSLLTLLLFIFASFMKHFLLYKIIYMKFIKLPKKKKNLIMIMDILNICCSLIATYWRVYKKDTGNIKEYFQAINVIIIIYQYINILIDISI